MTSPVETLSESPIESVKRGRGRPPGVKNKASTETVRSRGNPQWIEKERASEDAKKRWSEVTQNEADIRQEFSQIPLEEGLRLLEKMRHYTEIGAQVLSQRINVEDEKTLCATCHGPKPGNRPWAMIKPQRNTKTGTVSNIFFCSASCVALFNQKRYGLEKPDLPK